MKVLILLFTLILSASSNSKTRTPAVDYIEGVVMDVWCGEVDPYYIGDACLTFVQTPTSFFGIVTDDYDYSRSFPKSYGKLVRVAKSYLNKVKSKGAIMELKFIRRDAFYLVSSSVEAFSFTR
jgi:hypothetical protein